MGNKKLTTCPFCQVGIHVQLLDPSTAVMYGAVLGEAFKDKLGELFCDKHKTQAVEASGKVGAMVAEMMLDFTRSMQQ